MFRPGQPRLLKTALYDCLKLNEGRIPSSRTFSVTCIRKDDAGNRPSGESKNAGSPSPRTESGRSSARSNTRAVKGDSPSPRRVVDARSLAAPRSGSQANILRAPKLQKLKNSLLVRARKTGPSGMAVNARTRSATQRERPKRTRRQSEEEAGDESRSAEIEEVFREQAEKEKPVPVRYNPTEYDVSRLRATWPSLPIGETASAGSVLEKLSWMSSRYPNGYEPPHELAKRLFNGERVLFSSEEEKNQVIEEAKKLAQERADKLTQRKGELIEPEDTSFVSVSQDDREMLIREVVQGKYASSEAQHAGKPSVLGEVLRNLENNGTYRLAGKQAQFLDKLESLLASGQRAKRT
ncbi:hypothetical protein VTN77DRAFT_1398 [Rasamsonia byssochlamydoides]|uniref:uncharacterized protein n=1 Tax=Rasamsonia byssochlamydoides TaxID=89139 RepID=UPI0037424C0B